MLIVEEGTAPFDEQLRRIRDRGEDDHARAEPIVREILAAVRAEGDVAVLRYEERFGGRKPSTLVSSDYAGAAALARLEPEARAALSLAAERIERFHLRQRDEGFRYEEDGVTLGTRTRAIARAGVYAPGGKARYPSSVLMSAIPAKVAGVRDILLATPLAGDRSDDATLAAAHLAGVTCVLSAGGAQAIGAMAYGTQSVKRVDKIVGPGNMYVACAKRLVYGAVDIDGVAGPSEILVCADATANAEWVAADLLSQAEHDEAAYPMLVCDSVAFARAVEASVSEQLATLPRKAIASASLERNGVAWVATTRTRMCELADAIAPEHLSLHVEDPGTFFDAVSNAGAAFLGPLTPEAAGDYLAGPSHVLPTGTNVRFGSPLGVYDFLSRTSIIAYSATALARDTPSIATFARLEGLEGHARAALCRVNKRTLARQD